MTRRLEQTEVEITEDRFSLLCLLLLFVLLFVCQQGRKLLCGKGGASCEEGRLTTQKRGNQRISRNAPEKPKIM